MIAIASDHGGYELKEFIKKHLEKKGIKVKDFGCNGEKCDYPDYGIKVGEAVASGECEQGILCCGTGIGIGIAANKVKGIRAATVTSVQVAELAKQHNNANILCLGGRILTFKEGAKCVDAWMDADFEEGRHSVRIKKIADYEERNDR